MQELTLSEIQSVSIDILQDVHSFCINNDIHYSLMYGTLLGAIRHKGFIPWDDDVDIMMPRKDYERFCKSFTNQHYRLIYAGNDPSCLIAFARVCDMDRTFVKGNTWTKQKTGIWIDIFPIDGAEDDPAEFSKRYKKWREKWRKLLRNRDIASDVSPFFSRRKNIYIKIMNSLHLSFINRSIAKVRCNAIIKQAQSIEFGSTDHVCEFVSFDESRRIPFPLNVFDEYTSVGFEDKAFMIASGYDVILKACYGDYMKLPPIDRQVPKQSELSFYWKTNN